MSNEAIRDALVAVGYEFVQLEPRIRAHVLVCWLALLLVRVAERRTGQTWTTINRQLSRVHFSDPDRHRRHGRAHHPADQRPSRHCWRLRAVPTTRGDRPGPLLTSQNAGSKA